MRIVLESRAYINRLEGTGVSAGEVGLAEANDALRLARNLYRYFVDRAKSEPIIVFPPIAGCGLIDACEGDVIVGRRLYEVKAVDRNYRAIEVRQLLTYCALNHVSGESHLDGVGLLNPRRGTCVELDLDELCRDVSGESPAALFSEIVEFATSAETSS